MNTKTRVGALFLIFSLVNISFAQKIPPIDSMDKNLSEHKVNPFLKMLSEPTDNLQKLQARFELVAKYNSHLSLLEVLAPIAPVLIMETINQIVYSKNLRNLNQQTNYSQLKNLSDKLKKPLVELVQDYRFFSQHTPSAATSVLVETISPRSILALENIKSIADEMAANSDPYIKTLATELSKIDEIATDPSLSSQKALKHLTADRFVMGKQVLKALDNKINQVNHQAQALDVLYRKRNFGAVMVGAIFGIIIIYYDYFSESAQDQTTFLNTPLKDVSIDMRNDFLRMLTDPENGLGLSFEEAGYALALASR